MDSETVVIVCATMLAVGWGLKVVRDVLATSKGTKRSPALRLVVPGPPLTLRAKLAAEGPLVEAPLTGRACVAWTVVLSIKDGGIWKATVKRTGCAATFALQDSTDTLEVEAPAAEIAFENGTPDSGKIDADDERHRTFYAAHVKMPIEAVGLGGAVRYMERIVAPGDSIEIMGKPRAAKAAARVVLTARRIAD